MLQSIGFQSTVEHIGNLMQVFIPLSCKRQEAFRHRFIVEHRNSFGTSDC